MVSKIDSVLNGFVDELFSRRRHSALMGPRGGAVVSDPVTADKILRAPDRFPKPSTLFWAFGRNRFNSNGAEWRQRRELTQNGYSRAGRSESRAKVAEAYARWLSPCAARPADIMQALFAASTEIFCAALGCAVAAEPMLNFLDRVRELLKQVQYFSLVRPSDAERSLLEREAQSLLRDYTLEMERFPPLKALLDQLQTQGQSQIAGFHAAGELMMNAFADVESTVATLAIAIDRLGTHQSVQQELAQEADAADACPRLDCFTREIQRFYPSVPFVAREADSEAEVEGHPMKAGSVIIISIVGVHRHPDYWNNGDRFDCLRAEFTGDTYDRRAFIPFASGARVCGGARLAQLEIAEGLKAFVRRFTVLPGAPEISFDYAMAIRPKAWDQVKIVRR